MARVMTFATKFPAYHPNAGQPTHFVEKIFAGLAETDNTWTMPKEFTNYDIHVYYNTTPKVHTIREGHRWKVGDIFSPRIWSGRPYFSKQIIISPDIEVKKVWDFEIWGTGVISIQTNMLNELREGISCERIAQNDGFDDVKDFLAWFKYPKPFTGQIICWNDEIQY
jgi:hypothetical protein